MNLLLCGVNHQTAAVALGRSWRASFPDVGAAYDHLKLAAPEITESPAIMHLQPGRVDVRHRDRRRRPRAGCWALFCPPSGDCPGRTWKRPFMLHQDQEAVQHFFRVAASLDAMVVGEPQILGQMKAAYRQATDYRSTGPILNRLVHKAFSVAKRVRCETGIGDHAVSVSYAAVTMAKKIFGDLAGQKRPLIGGRRNGGTGPGAPQGPRRGQNYRGQPHFRAGRATGPEVSAERQSLWKRPRISSSRPISSSAPPAPASSSSPGTTSRG